MPPTRLPVLPQLPQLDPATMPRHRGDCLPGGRNELRPCPWICCRHSLAAEGSPGACTLDLADKGGATLGEIGQLLNLTRERVRQLEARALSKVRKRTGRAAHAGLRELALLPDEPPPATSGR